MIQDSRITEKNTPSTFNTRAYDHVDCSKLCLEIQTSFLLFGMHLLMGTLLQVKS